MPLTEAPITPAQSRNTRNLQKAHITIAEGNNAATVHIVNLKMNLRIGTKSTVVMNLQNQITAETNGGTNKYNKYPTPTAIAR